MSKEKKIGLSVLGGLMMSLVGTLAMRMSMAREDAASALRDAPDAVAEAHAPYKPSKLLNRLAAEPTATQPTRTEERPTSRYEEPRTLAEEAPQAVGDRYAMPATAEAPLAESHHVEHAQPVSIATALEESMPVGAPQSGDPFHAASLGEPVPLTESAPPHHHMPSLHEPSQAVASEIMSPMPAHEANHAHGLLEVESEPALQASHEGTHSGNVQHAVPTASNFIQSHTHTPTTSTPQGPYAPGHNGMPNAATPSNVGSRYGAPPQHPQPPHASAPHYDIYGRDVPAEADPPQAQHQYPTPGHPPQHQYSAVEERFEPELERRIPGMPHYAHTGSEEYTIRPNDSFYSISERVYGTGSYFKALEEHNRQRVPYSDRMRVGDVITTPHVEVLEEKYPDLVPKRRTAPAATAQSRLTSAASQVMAGGKVYVVEQGDSLFDIARNELGKASRWSEIYELNRHRLGDDIDYLAPGTELVLPSAVVPSREPLTTERQRANATR